MKVKFRMIAASIAWAALAATAARAQVVARVGPTRAARTFGHGVAARGADLRAATAADTILVSLEEATRRAVEVSPAVAEAEGAELAPRGLRGEYWGPFAGNPTLEFGRVRRQSAVLDTYDRDWAITQELDPVAWYRQRQSANALVTAARERRSDAVRLAALEARRAYAALALAERRASLTDSAAAFADRLAFFARRQFEAGEANRLEVNTTVLEAARARSAAARVHADNEAAAAELARLLAVPWGTAVRTRTLPSLPELRWGSDSVLYAIALERRPDLRAAEAARRGAELGVSAVRLRNIPTVAVSVVGGTESGTDQLKGIVFGVQVPLFRRQQAATGEARAAFAAAQAAQVAQDRAVRAEVVAAAARYLRSRTAERRFATEVLAAADENVALTERALVEGEVGLTDVLVLRNAAVSAQLEYLDVLRDAANAWFELAAALAAEPAELTSLLGSGN